MQSSAQFSTLTSADMEVNSQFNVVIAYEDFETGKIAKRTYDVLLQNLGQDCQFNNQMWKFDVLGIPKLRELAAKDVTMADVVIISSQGIRPLPAGTKAWIDLWLAEKTNAIALVALFGEQGEHLENARATRTYLAQVAKRAGIEFFAQPDLWPGKANTAVPVSMRNLPMNEDLTLPAISSLKDRDTTFHHWGINE
jgi:hypothetical protein